MKDKPLPPNWSSFTTISVAEYIKFLFDFTVFRRYVRVNYCYCLDDFGRKLPTPFTHNSDGTCPVRAYKLLYILITVCDLRNRPK